MTQLIVLGGHRSGTSMTAGILHRLGVYMGKGISEQGHYEDMAASAINRHILMAAGGIWRKPPGAAAIEAVTALDDRIARFVAQRDAGHEVWGFKDPSTSLTAPCWARHMPEARYVWVQRKANDWVASMVAYFGWSEYECADLALLFTERIAAFLASRQYLAVEYERTVTEPDWSVGRLAGYAGVGLTEAAVQLIKRRCE